MSARLLFAHGLVALGSLGGTLWAHAGDAVRGQMLYETRCIGCHSLDSHRVGPAHRGVVGRGAGAALGYDYSPALRAAPLVWTPRTLDLWLTNPEAFVPGQRMGYRVDDAKDRVDLIAYLITATNDSASP